MSFTESKTLINRFRFLTIQKRKDAFNETKWEEWVGCLLSWKIEHESTSGWQRRPKKM